MENRSNRFLLGPFFISQTCSDLCGEGVDATGYALQFSTEHDSYTVRIFKKQSSFSKQPTTLDYLFHESDSPCVTVHFFPSLAKRTSKGQFIGITNLIAALYEEYAPATPLHELLEEFSRCFPFQCVSAWEPPQFDILSESLTRVGYAVSSLVSDGDCVRLDLCWLSKFARESGRLAQNIPAGVFQFRPRPDGTLGKGTCPALWEVSIQLRLFELIKATEMKHPIDCLSENGIKRCLSVFEWQPKHKMTKAELAEKRLCFVREKRGLWPDIKALSVLLKQEGLYSPSTSESQIAKTVKAMIAKLNTSGSSLSKTDG
ncbi:MAG: hypothetical protein ACKVY0_15235 [Prosthecobacter sp.]|uniref:hypothetical protein n=1 Tax=Prosthecobacter sp. TaxID=1965333 RepID=UPI003901965F